MLNFGEINNLLFSSLKMPMWGCFNLQFPQWPIQMPFFNLFQPQSYFMPTQGNNNSILYSSPYPQGIPFNAGVVNGNTYLNTTPLFNFNANAYNFIQPNLNSNKFSDNIALLNQTTKPENKTKNKGNFKPKVTSSDLSVSGLLIVKEEVEAGYSVHKGGYVNLKDLKSDMKETLVKLDKKARELGYTMVVIDGFRSHKTQANAYRKKPKWCARPGKSAHEYGAAVDLALYDKNGKQISIDKVPEFGRYAQFLNLVWGATWSKKYEPWHFNFVNWQSRTDIKSEYDKWKNYYA